MSEIADIRNLQRTDDKDKNIPTVAGMKDDSKKEMLPVTTLDPMLINLLDWS